jgi:hypothetical protein
MPSDDQYSSEKVARRRDEVIRRMANTPPHRRITLAHRQRKKANWRGSTGSEITRRRYGFLVVRQDGRSCIKALIDHPVWQPHP